MDTTTHTDPTSYAEAAAILSKGKTSASRKARKIGNNTHLVRLSPREIGVRLHGTYIVRFYAEGCTVLNHGGYQTATTKERLHRYTPKSVRVYQKKGKWYVDSVDAVKTETRDFVNGIVVDSITGRLFFTLPRYRGTMADMRKNAARLAKTSPVDSSAERAIHIHTPYFPED